MVKKDTGSDQCSMVIFPLYMQRFMHLADAFYSVWFIVIRGKTLVNFISLAIELLDLNICLCPFRSEILGNFPVFRKAEVAAGGGTRGQSCANLQLKQQQWVHEICGKVLWDADRDTRFNWRFYWRLRALEISRGSMVCWNGHPVADQCLWPHCLHLLRSAVSQQNDCDQC